MSRTKLAKKSQANDPEIVIDKEKGLVFKDEDALYDHFEPQIQSLESIYLKWRSESDFSDEESEDYEDLLVPTLETPDEIWINDQLVEGEKMAVYIKVFEIEDSGDPREFILYLAITYLTHQIPSFIYLHFPTKDQDLVERYREGELMYSRAHEEAPEGAIDGDALVEGDELATGLYHAMLLVRDKDDIPPSDFTKFAEYRESSVEEADEIWRNADLMGNILVNFICEVDDDVEYDELYYIVVTLEDPHSDTHSLLFSFPTKDKSLVDRYRHGENLQAEEVSTESPH